MYVFLFVILVRKMKIKIWYMSKLICLFYFFHFMCTFCTERFFCTNLNRFLTPVQQNVKTLQEFVLQFEGTKNKRIYFGNQITVFFILFFL